MTPTAASLLGRRTPALRREDVAASAVPSVALTVAAVALIAVSLADAELRLDGLGIARSLSPLFYVGVACLPLASALEWRREGGRADVVCFQVCLFVAALWLMPYLIEETPRFRTSYTSFGYVDPVVRGDGLLPDMLVYHNWPLFPLLFAGLVDGLGVDPVDLMAFFPVVIVLLYLLPLAALLRIATDGRAGAGATAGLWLFVVFDWSGQDYFSPQAVALLFFLAWVTVLAHVAIARRGAVTPATAALVIGGFALIVVTHVLTAMIAVFVLAALTVTRQVRRPGLLLACTLLFFAWQAYAADPFFARYGDRILETVLAAGDFVQQNVSGRLGGSEEHLLIGRVRLLDTLLPFALGLLALVAVHRAGRWPAGAKFAVTCLVAIAIVTPVSAYGGEMLIRALLFSLPFLAILVAVAMDRSRVVRYATAAVLVVAAPLHVLAHYGNESYDYVSPGEIDGFRFIAEELAPAKVYGGYPGGSFENVARLEWRNTTVPTAKELPARRDFLAPQTHSWTDAPGPIYVAFSRGDDASAALFYDRPGLMRSIERSVARDPRFRAVYRTPDMRIYRWRP